MSLKYGILGLLNYGPSTGYDLDKTFKESLNFFWQVQTSQVYRELNAMEKQGWIKSEVIIQTDKPNKKVYSLTSIGHEELMKWLAYDSMVDDVKIRDPFLVKLFFSAQRSYDFNLDTMKRFKSLCEHLMSSVVETEHQCRMLESSNKDALYWGFTASFGRYYYEMCVHWANEVINKLEASR